METNIDTRKMRIKGLRFLYFPRIFRFSENFDIYYKNLTKWGQIINTSRLDRFLALSHKSFIGISKSWENIKYAGKTWILICLVSILVSNICQGKTLEKIGTKWWYSKISWSINFNIFMICDSSIQSESIALEESISRNDFKYLWSR